MNKERWIFVVLGFLFLLYVLVQYYAPKPQVWEPTYDIEDEHPYGAFILGERLSDLFEKVTFSKSTFYERRDSLGNLLILTEQFRPSASDFTELNARLAAGHSVLIAATQFSKGFQDSLKVRTFIQDERLVPIYTDTVKVKFNEDQHSFSSALVFGYFTGLGGDWQTLATTKRPILISRKTGKGKLILCSAPLLFSNYGLMQDPDFASYALSQLDQSDVHYTQYYHLGKQESTSPFRYILTESALTWALYLTIATLLAFLIINSRRKQRPVPVINPPQNTTVHFIKTMGALFYREKKHVKAAQKLATHFFLELQKRYFVKPSFTEKYYQFIASKTGLEKAEVIRIFEQIEALPKRTHMAGEELRNFQHRLMKFNYHR